MSDNGAKIMTDRHKNMREKKMLKFDRTEHKIYNMVKINIH